MTSVKSQFEGFLKIKKDFVREKTLLMKRIRSELISYCQEHQKLNLSNQYYLYVNDGRLLHSLGHKVTDEVLFNLSCFNPNVREILGLV